MEEIFARRMQHVRASEIREILKVTERPDFISLAGGLPAPELFPVTEIAEAARRCFAEDGAAALQYSTTEGYAPLRAAIARRLPETTGARPGADEILITTGSQQGLDLVGKVFLDEGDVVLCESPTYLGGLQAFRVFGPRFVEVETDDEGMIPASLERCLEAEPRAKLLYAIPDFQNPAGRTWSLARREAVLAIVERHRMAVIEDCPYGELRFSGSPLPSLMALAGPGQVLQLGTFSKILCPGLRVAWIAANRAMIEKLVLVKQAADLHSPSLNQRLVSRLLETYDLAAGIERMRDLYRRRCGAMLAALEGEFPEGATWTRPEGGLFVWVTLPEGVSARDLLTRAIGVQVAFVPGGAFFPNGGHENTLRLNFSIMTPERIAEGVRRLGALLVPAPL
jgi:2-aminoadipate transaminase